MKHAAEGVPEFGHNHRFGNSTGACDNVSLRVCFIPEGVCSYKGADGISADPDAFQNVRGMDGWKESTFTLAGTHLRVAVASGLANTRKLLRVLSDEDNRKARFRTVIALITQNPKPDTHLFEGIVEGEITREKRGEKGFGYDPVFKPDGYEGTFAELGVDVKNQISHRARAVQKLVKYLSGLLLFYLFTFLPLNVNGQIGTWRNYMAYHDVQNISSTGTQDLSFQGSCTKNSDAA